MDRHPKASQIAMVTQMSLRIEEDEQSIINNELYLNNFLRNLEVFVR